MIASQLVSSKGFRAIALRYTVRYQHDNVMVNYILFGTKVFVIQKLGEFNSDFQVSFYYWFTGFPITISYCMIQEI